MRERQLIGEGGQHKVWESQKTGWVLKQPKKGFLFFFNLWGFSSKEIKQDFF